MDGNLFLITSGSLRKRMLEQVLTDACNQLCNVSFSAKIDLHKLKWQDSIRYIVLDFPNIVGSAKSILCKVKLSQPDAFVIGIHFYLNRKLIQPLMDTGLDGYLLYNPTKSDIKKAIEIIESGQKYLPPQLY